MKSLYTFFKDVLKNNNNANYFYEEYLDFNKKYQYSLITMSDICISSKHKESGITEEETLISYKIIYKFVNFTRNKKNEYYNKLVEILEKEIPLSNIENIQGYKEFDFIRWDFENEKIGLVYKPKNVQVSCWGVDSKNVNYKKNKI